MIYKEKFELIVKAIAEAKKYARKEYFPKLYYNEESGLKDVDLNQIRDILLQLQDDEKIIALKDIPTVMKPPFEQIDDLNKTINYFTIDILDSFDAWWETFLLREKGELGNISFVNLLKIYDVVIDIDQELQIENSHIVRIPLLPQVVRFAQLFPADDMGMRDRYKEFRWNAVEYLKKRGIVSDMEFLEDLGYGKIAITIVSVGKFDEFYNKIEGEYKKRYKASKTSKSENTAETLTKTDRVVKDEAIWPDGFKWEGKDFIFGKYGSISLVSNDRKHILKVLTDKKGGWATIRELKGNKDAGYVRSTIKQIEDRLPKEAKGHIKIVSTQDDDSIEKPSTGAYRIKVQ